MLLTGFLLGVTFTLGFAIVLAVVYSEPKVEKPTPLQHDHKFVAIKNWPREDECICGKRRYKTLYNPPERSIWTDPWIETQIRDTSTLAKVRGHYLRDRFWKEPK